MAATPKPNLKLLPALATRGARRCKLSRNAYIEALIAEHLEESGPFIVLRTKLGAKL